MLFFVNCSLTPTRNKIFHVLRTHKKKSSAILKGCRALNIEVVALVTQARTEPVSSATQETEKWNGTQKSEERNRAEKPVRRNKKKLVKWWWICERIWLYLFLMYCRPLLTNSTLYGEVSRHCTIRCLLKLYCNAINSRTSIPNHRLFRKIKSVIGRQLCY